MMRLRYDLVSDDEEFSFMLQIHQSSKNLVRISLHCQDEDSKIGLIRFDYNAGHINPEVASPTVPDDVKKYAGKIFADDEHHVHIHVEGYKSLSWAVPMQDMTEVALEMRDDHIADDFENALQEFLRIINVETKVFFDRSLL